MVKSQGSKRARMSRSKGPKAQLSMMDFATNKRGHSDSTDEEPLSKKLSPDADGPTPKGLKRIGGGKWASVGATLLIYTTDGIEASSKIAGFDMDGTLIKTKSGATFPKNSNDWQLWHPTKVANKVQQLHAEGYKIVIFTNQRGIEKNKVNVGDFKNKIVNVSKALRVPIQAFISTGHVSFRKPYIGMFLELENNYNDNVPIDRNASIYCGDAAGRVNGMGRKADHSCADRSFAFNLGVPFKTPEQLFLGQTNEEPYEMVGFNSAEYFKTTRERFGPANTKFPYNSGTQELIVMVGSPASGKSHISKMLAQQHNYSIVNQDTLGNKGACEKMVVKLLNEGKNVIVDNTNRDVFTRKFYIQAAKKHNCRIRAIVMNCEKKMAMHNNVYREVMGTDDKHKGISSMVFNMFFSNLEEPTQKEGFNDIIRCNFVPEFADEKSRQVYSYILNEK